MNDPYDNLADDELLVILASNDAPAVLTESVRARLASNPALRDELEQLRSMDAALRADAESLHSASAAASDAESRDAFAARASQARAERSLRLSIAAVRKQMLYNAAASQSPAPHKPSIFGRLLVGGFGAVAALVLVAFWFASFDPQKIFENQIANSDPDVSQLFEPNAMLERDVNLLLNSLEGSFASEPITDIFASELASLDRYQTEFDLFEIPQ